MQEGSYWPDVEMQLGGWIWNNTYTYTLTYTNHPFILNQSLNEKSCRSCMNIKNQIAVIVLFLKSYLDIYN